MCAIALEKSLKKKKKAQIEVVEADSLIHAASTKFLT